MKRPQREMRKRGQMGANGERGVVNLVIKTDKSEGAYFWLLRVQLFKVKSSCIA